MNSSAAALVADKRFKCTECGKCCSGAGEVWVSEVECTDIAAHLNLQLGDFLSTYCKSFGKVVGWRMLKYKAGPDKVYLLPVSGLLSYLFNKCFASHAVHCCAGGVLT